MLVCPRCSALFVRDVVCCGLDGERLVEVDRDPLVGRRLDRYLIREVLGDGGMARVYRAEHVHLGQPVALKILHGDMASERRFAERFRREARSAAQIRHPHVVEVKDFGITEAGLNYMAMELLEGTTLSELLQQQRRPDLSMIAEVIRQAALGLSAAHGLGFVHRDLKPRNLILVREAGALRLKILDFGLVRLLESTDTRLTVHGQVFGTPAYMAPEQIVDGPIDARTDLYALGVILYELLAGRRPFAGDMGELLDKQVRAWPPELDDRSGLGALALAMMSKSPAGRPSSALEVVAAIDASWPVTSGFGSGPDARAPGAPTPGASPQRREETTPLRGRRHARPPDHHAAPLLERSEAPDLEQRAIEAIAAQARPAWPLRLLVLGVLGGGLALAYPRYASLASSIGTTTSPSAQRAEFVAATPSVTPRAAPASPVASSKAGPKIDPPHRSSLLPRLPSAPLRGPGHRVDRPLSEEDQALDPDEPARATSAPVTPGVPSPRTATISASPPADALPPIPEARIPPRETSTVASPVATATAS